MNRRRLIEAIRSLSLDEGTRQPTAAARFVAEVEKAGQRRNAIKTSAQAMTTKTALSDGCAKKGVNERSHAVHLGAYRIHPLRDRP